MSGRRGNFDADDDCLPAEDEPVYSIGIAAEIIRIHPRTLRMYESEGVIVPARRSGRRFYSPRDLRWVRCIRSLLHREGLNLSGVRSLLAVSKCWELRGCPPGRRKECTAYGRSFVPCWALVGTGETSCHKCDVYQQARKLLCEKAKLGS